MRRLIESLTPGDRQICWKRIGGVFALYLVAMIAAAGVFVGHRSQPNVARDSAATVAIDKKPPAGESRMRQLARYN